MRTRKLIGFFVLCMVLGACTNPEVKLAQLWHAKNSAVSSHAGTGEPPAR
jgi:hypothetical protein